MSFSNQVKLEICEAYKMPDDCKVVLLYGLLCSAKKYNFEQIEFYSECRDVSLYFSRLVSRLFGYKSEVVDIYEGKTQGKELYGVKINDKNVCRSIVESYDCGKYSDKVSLISLDEAITWAFIKGIFLGSGSITDPENDYHLEFNFKQKDSAIFSENMLSSLELKPKRTTRRDNHIVYFKDSSAIEDILTGMGAIKKSLELMDSKVIKDLRNRLNRRNNCETANIKKTVDVAIKQLDAINLIISKRGIDFLQDDLQKIAKIRLENPEMSLNLMAKELYGEFSKSGIDRRLKKIVQIAEEIEQKRM